MSAVKSSIGRAAAVVFLLGAGRAEASVFTPGTSPAVEVVTQSRTEEVWKVGAVTVTLRKSPGPDEADRDAFCRAGGVDLTVAGKPSPVEAAPIHEACLRLETDAPVLASAAARFMPMPHPLSRPLLRFGTVLLLLLTLLHLPRSLAPWLWAAAGLLARKQFATPTVLMGVAYPYERMLTYAGLKPESLMYGAGWPAFMDVVRPLFGSSPEALHTVNLTLSVLGIPLAWEAARRLTGDRGVCHAAAALAAMLPLTVHLARTEEYYVLAAFLHAVALVGLARNDTWGARMTTLAAGILSNVRPDQIPVALGIVAILVARGRWLEATGILLPLGLRAWALRAVTEGPPYALRELLYTLAHPIGPGSRTVLFDPYVTPLWLMPLALVGLLEAKRRGWRGGTVALFVLAAWLPYLGFSRHTDLLRFQLPTMASVGLLAAMAVPVVRRQALGVRALLVLTIAGGTYLAREPGGGPMVHAVEHALLRKHVCALPAGTVVRYEDAEDPQGGMAKWVHAVCGVEMVPLKAQNPEPGELLWIGRAHRAPDAVPVPACTTETLMETFAEPWNGDLHPLGPDPIRIGLYRVVRCG